MDILENKTRIEERLVQRASMAGIPLSLGFELTPHCNFNCNMCYIRDSRAEEMLSVENWLAIAEEALEQGTLFIMFSGGEPLLYPGFKELYLKLQEMGYILTINTNGSLINEDWAEFFGANPPRRINITLYGASSDTYERICHNAKGYSDTIKAIHLLRAHGVDIKLNGSLIKDNFEDLESLLEFAHKENIFLKVDPYMFPASRSGRNCFDRNCRLEPEDAAEAFLKIERFASSEDELQAKLNRYRELYELCVQNEKEECEDIPENATEVLPCRAGKSSAWINWKGELSPCVFMEMPAVSLQEKSFAEAWEKIKEDSRTITLPAKCTACKKRSVCIVCCASAFWEKESAASNENYLCEFTDEIIRQAVEGKTKLG